MTTDKTLHIYFVLDRSGSMENIASDVIGGFNAFVTTQQTEGSTALMTLIQFDSVDPYEVLAAATPISEIQKLSPTTFQPRGGTPLYDAIGHAIADATIRNEKLTATGGAADEVLFIIFTDGQENQSREYDRAAIATLVSKREKAGWTFVYMGPTKTHTLREAKSRCARRTLQTSSPMPRAHHGLSWISLDLFRASRPRCECLSRPTISTSSKVTRRPTQMPPNERLAVEAA